MTWYLTNFFVYHGGGRLVSSGTNKVSADQPLRSAKEVFEAQHELLVLDSLVLEVVEDWGPPVWGGVSVR